MRRNNKYWRSARLRRISLWFEENVLFGWRSPRRPRNHFCVIIEYGVSQPRIYGPFDTKADAEAWLGQMTDRDIAEVEASYAQWMEPPPPHPYNWTPDCETKRHINKYAGVCMWERT